MQTHSKHSGFTLIELMIVVAIMGIIAAIAYPSYQDAVRKGHRREAQDALVTMQLVQEKWRANNPEYTNTYTTDIGALPTVDFYTITNVGAANTYTLTADPTGGQVNDTQGGTACDPLTINQAGTKTPAACW